MPDLCLCRLIVSGPTDQVRRFMRDAAPRPGAQSAGAPWRGDDAPGPLSFQRLLPIGEDEDADDIYGTPWHEPEQVTRTRRVPITASTARVEYGFVTKWSEPHLLIRHASKAYPTLDFVLGAVAPAADEANSWYFREGRGRNWKMSGRERERIRRETYRREGVTDPEDADLWTDVQEDHAQMAAVVAHWTPARMRAAGLLRGLKSAARHKRR